MSNSVMYFTIKRIIDVFFSIISIIILMPLFLVVALLIKIDDGGCIFYLQERVGKGENIFSLVKFRSMTDEKREPVSQTYLNSADVTKIGAILRRYKIDELPQLFNVLKGDLSLVGPRPCLPSTINEFKGESKKRHSIRPGLSGLSQVNGNIYLSWQERLKYDLLYVEKKSFWLDFKIIVTTIYLIVVGEEKGKMHEDSIDRWG